MQLYFEDGTLRPEGCTCAMTKYAGVNGNCPVHGKAIQPARAPDAVEAKVAEKARLYVEDFCKPIYYHSENCHKAALLSYLAGHAEGQKDSSAVEFAEWAVINCTEIPASPEIDNPPIWTYERKDYTTAQLLEIYRNKG